jgi:dihydropteroate synthase
VSAAPTLILRAGAFTLELGRRPLLMGLLDASPQPHTLDAQRQRAGELLAAGASIIEIVGPADASGRPCAAPERVVALVEHVAGELGAIVSVSGHPPAVARAAVAAGAGIVEDPSAAGDPALAQVCADSGAALVIAHGGTAESLRERMTLAGERGVEPEQVIIGVGGRFASDPAGTIALLRSLHGLRELGRPLLLRISEQDLVGALAGSAQRALTGAALAALAHGVEHGAQIFAVGDVDGAADFLTVRAALAGDFQPSRDLALGEEIRYERPSAN